MNRKKHAVILHRSQLQMIMPLKLKHIRLGGRTRQQNHYQHVTTCASAPGHTAQITKRALDKLCELDPHQLDVNLLL